jgi:hypothetical protein
VLFSAKGTGEDIYWNVAYAILYIHSTAGEKVNGSLKKFEGFFSGL